MDQPHTDEGPHVDLASWTSHLARIFAGRKVILAFVVLAGMTERVQQLKEYGACRPLLIPRGVGTGPAPSAADADVHLLQLPPSPLLTDEVREVERLSVDPSAEVRRAVATYEPTGEAVWWLAPFCHTGELLGRPAYGGRRAEWIALEDKMLVDRIWSACGVPSPPTRHVSCVYDEIVTAATELDAGDGTVWSGDAREGLNGGAEYVRWVRDAAQAGAAYSFFADHCDRVRVMPFLDGTPCSIHGFVLPDGVAVFRPVEMMVMRRRDTGRFVYGGLSTWWDPPDVDRARMRDVARRVGTWLSDTVDYRGGFSVDGVLTRDGFLPTEMNPRFSGGLSTVAHAVPQLPLELLQLNVVAGLDPGIAATDLERLIVTAADRTRAGKMMGVSTAVHVTSEDSVDLVWDAGPLRAATDGEAPTGTATLGPSSVGGFVAFEPMTDVLQPGMGLAQMSAALLRFADARWGTEFGPVEPAPDVRPR